MENKKGLVQNIQGVRGYAILLIFFSHCNFGLNEMGINRTTWLGAFGVSLFIILSGYLLLERHSEEKLELFPYVERKLRRFYPLHILTLIAALPFAIKSLLHFDRIQIVGLLANITLLQSWIPNSSVYFSYNAVSWYLSMTLFCMVISPIVLKIWKNNSSNMKICAMLVLCILFDGVLYMIFGQASVAHWILYIFPVVRSIEYIFGGGIWKLRKNFNLPNYAENIIGIVALVLSFIISYFSVSANDELYAVVAWVIPSMLLIIFATSHTELSKIVFSNRVVLFFGNISFEFFLFHQLCIRYIEVINRKIDIQSGFVIVCLNLIVSVLITLLWRTVWDRKITSCKK